VATRGAQVSFSRSKIATSRAELDDLRESTLHHS
jgi:hypothetical protein